MDEKPAVHPRLPSTFEPPPGGVPATLLLQEDESIAHPKNTGASNQGTVAIAADAHVDEKPGYRHAAVSPPPFAPRGSVVAHPESATIHPSSDEIQASQVVNDFRKEAIEHDLGIDRTQLPNEPAATVLTTLEVERQPVETPISNFQSTPSTQGTAAAMTATQSHTDHAPTQTASVPALIPALEEEMSALIVKPTSRVTVHIGRIDIRVASPQNPASSRKNPASQRKPVMSLDHYLRERSKGKP